MSAPENIHRASEETDQPMVTRILKATLTTRRYVIGIALEELAKLHVEDRVAEIGHVVERGE
jgi:hypothetical protein